LHFVTVKYSLQQFDKTVLHWNGDSRLIHRSHVTTISRVLQRIGFRSERSNPYIKTFSTLSTMIVNFEATMCNNWTPCLN